MTAKISANPANNGSLAAENEDLRQRLRDAEETLEAIRSGEVEALVVGDQVFMLQSAEAASNRFRGEVLEQISDIAVAVDLNDRVIYLNQAAERKYGVLATDVLGRKQDDLFNIRWLNDDDKAAKDRAILEDGVWRGENAHFLADGSGFYAECTIGRLTDPEGDLSGFLSVIRDITDRKRSEQELREAHDELERRVADRTKELGASNLALKEEVAIRGRVEKQRGDLLQRLVNSQEDERRRIARDIHDKLGQRITALRLQITSLADANAGKQSLDGILEQLQRTALRLDSEVSFFSWELRPALLDDIGLPEATKAYVDDWSHNYSISSEFSVRGFGEKRLDPDTETHLYRIMQEALNNVVKHANATRAGVLLEWNPKEVVLIVEDNGLGFDVTKLGERDEVDIKLGLVGIKERAALVGGEVHIESSDHSGTALFVRIPASLVKAAPA